MSATLHPTQALAAPLPLLPLIRGVIFPTMVSAIPVGRTKSVALVRSLRPGDMILVGVQRRAESGEPGLEDLHPTATLARVNQVVRMASGGFRVILHGQARARLDAIESSDPFLRARAAPLEEIAPVGDEARALSEEMRVFVEGLIQGGDAGAERLLRAHASDLSALTDHVAAELGLETDLRAELLNEADIAARARRVLALGRESSARNEVKETIEREVRKKFGENQREAILREQLKAIKKELGNDSGEDGDDDLRTRIEAKKLPEEVRKVAARELDRLEALNPAQAEYGVIRNYLEWIADLPWTEVAEAPIELDAIDASLDADHYGLSDVKRRILEHMAVLKVTGDVGGTILCLAGPPGVGKTSLAQSVADAIGRPLVRIALGGVRDEAEIRGHRRTYVGALPGRFVHALKKAGVSNPVVVLDEIDKLGKSWMGSPEAALLEVLDPEQNARFTDHYMELPIDLSRALFICTANELSNLSGPLRDRLEIIEISGYTEHEKIRIARDHLIPKQLERHGLLEREDVSLQIDDDALAAIIHDHTREAGVRGLERQLTKICRALTLEIARGERAGALTIDAEEVPRYLGKPRFFSEVAARTALPGVATGLAWTPMGGDILFIETTRMRGKGRLEVTGQLGDVMKESARAALAYLRTHADALGVDPNFLEENDLHLHIPAGAIPKDGPSAGVTIFTALTSLLTGRRVRPDTAMTGECSLRGRVLPVGGIKSKVLAAHRAGITRVILPLQNAKDLDEIPPSARDAIEIILAEDMDQVLEAALEEFTHLGEVPGAPESVSGGAPRA